MMIFFIFFFLYMVFDGYWWFVLGLFVMVVFVVW